jgi:RNA polymerase sigma-70 factor (ECF subfamily)
MAIALTAELMINREAATDTLTPPVEVELVLRSRRGDEAAFAEIVQLYQHRIFNFVLARLGNRQTAEDVTQEVLVKAYYNLDRLREPAKFKSWVFSIAHNHLRDLVRRKRLDMADVEDGHIEHYVDPADPEKELGRSSMQRMVSGALEMLKPDQRQMLLLCDLEGLSYKQIADIMHIPLGTVQSRIFYSRKRVKEILISEFGYSGDEI